MASTFAEVPVTPTWDASARTRPDGPSGAPSRRADLSGAVSWTSEDERSRVWLQVQSGVPVLSFEGNLGRQGLGVLRCGVDAAIGLRVARVVVDLSQARLDHSSIALLGLVRRYALRHGVALWLACVPAPAMDLLERLQVAALYRIQPTVPIAVAVAASLRPEVRGPWPLRSAVRPAQADRVDLHEGGA